ncbi:MAG: hypothetical protein R6U11_12275 [Bacteroidales bacterium]
MENLLTIDKNMENEKLEKLDKAIQRPAIIAVINVLVYALLFIHFLVGVFTNISAFSPDLFNSIPSLSLMVFATKIMTNSLHPIFIVLLMVLPIIGIAGFIFTLKGSKIGYWLFSISQLLFLAIPLTMFSASSYYIYILITLIPSLIILPIMIFYFGRYIFISMRKKEE